MIKNLSLEKQIWNVIRIFIVAIIVYLALTVKVQLIWESDDLEKFDYLAAETNTNYDNAYSFNEEGEHWSSSIFSKLCSKYSNICKKVVRSWEFTDEQKSVDFAYIAYLIYYLDNNTKQWKYPLDVLKSMIINEKKGTRRWSASWDTVKISKGGMNYDNEFFQVISHEMWHIIDLWALQWGSSKKSPLYTEFGKEVFQIDDPSIQYYKYSWSSEKVRKTWVTKEDFCSWYGMSDPFEDFAECHNLYLNHHDYFQKIALSNASMKNKYNFFSNLYGWKYINDSEVNYENRNKSYRAWDTTKLREW